MKRSGKKLAVIGALLIAAGLLVSLIVLVMTDYDLSKLEGNRYTEKTYTISEKASSINITADTADVEFVFSEDLNYKVVCSETEKLSYSVYVDNGCLYVEPANSNKWYDFLDLKNIFGTWGENKVVVHLPHPRSDYTADLKVETDTGDIKILDFMKFKNIDLTSDTGEIIVRAPASEIINIHTKTGDVILDTSRSNNFHVETGTGDVMVSSVTGGDVYVKTNTGDITIENCTLTKGVRIESNTGEVTLRLTTSDKGMRVTTNTGDVIFDRADADEMHITTDTGDVKGSLLTEKIFYVQTDKGHVNVPKITGADGLCEITTDTGDVNITIE